MRVPVVVRTNYATDPQQVTGLGWVGARWIDDQFTASIDGGASPTTPTTGTLDGGTPPGRATTGTLDGGHP